MNNPAQNPSHLNRREALQAVALTTATAASGLTGAASAATPTINVSDRNAGASLGTVFPGRPRRPCRGGGRWHGILPLCWLVR